MKTQIFTKEFLAKLHKKFHSMDVLHYLMEYRGYSFTDAILELSESVKMKPEYFVDAKEPAIECKIQWGEKMKTIIHESFEHMEKEKIEVLLSLLEDLQGKGKK